jgi:hypothetical protein
MPQLILDLLSLFFIACPLEYTHGSFQVDFAITDA